MKFSLRLDESLFDDYSEDTTKEKSSNEFDDFDDDFSEYESEHNIENVLPGPAEGTDSGVAGELIALINDEWEAIQGYNNAIATLRALIDLNPFYEDAINVLTEIVAEENTHVGQLQEVLRRISPNAAEIEEGTKEAKSQLGLVGGVLPVQTWDNVNTNNKQNTIADVDEVCTLTDVDDDM